MGFDKRRRSAVNRAFQVLVKNGHLCRDISLQKVTENHLGIAEPLPDPVVQNLIIWKSCQTGAQCQKVSCHISTVNR